MCSMGSSICVSPTSRRSPFLLLVLFLNSVKTNEVHSQINSQIHKPMIPKSYYWSPNPPSIRKYLFDNHNNLFCVPGHRDLGVNPSQNGWGVQMGVSAPAYPWLVVGGVTRKRDGGWIDPAAPLKKKKKSKTHVAETRTHQNFEVVQDLTNEKERHFATDKLRQHRQPNKMEVIATISLLNTPLLPLEFFVAMRPSLPPPRMKATGLIGGAGGNRLMKLFEPVHTFKPSKFGKQ